MISRRLFVDIGSVIDWDVFKRRGIICLSMKLSVWMLAKSEYSYDQYHWCPMHFIEIEGLAVSSIRYKAFIEGRAIKINMIDGIIVHTVSISCPSDKNLLNFLLFFEAMIIYRVIVVILTSTIIEWSWKNNNCSMILEFLSWNEILVHVGITGSLRMFG